jgi:hypothetical protein
MSSRFISMQTYDANERFTYAVDEDAMCVIGGPDGITAEEDVFILDHAITVKCVCVRWPVAVAVYAPSRLMCRTTGSRTFASCCVRCLEPKSA